MLENLRKSSAFYNFKKALSPWPVVVLYTLHAGAAVACNGLSLATVWAGLPSGVIW